MSYMLNSIFLFIDSILYWFISVLYQVFMVISKVNLFTETTLRSFTDRVFIILGIVMLFYIAYEILVLIISPEKVSGENQAKTLVGKLIKSLIIIILLPTIFKYMQIFQTNILTSNVIGNIIIGSSSGSSSDKTIKKAGTSMALSIGQAFYHPIGADGKEYSYLDCVDDDISDKAPACAEFVAAYDKALDNNDPRSFFVNKELKNQLNLDGDDDKNADKGMRYHPVISTISAILAGYMIVLFCIDIGIRVAKLGFLQIIAPIPIAMNITQKEPLSQTTWVKSLISTYLEIFMKLIIIYFSMFAITLVPEMADNLFQLNQSDVSPLIQMMAIVVIILGILQFAKNAPELIKSLFNISDFGHGLSIKKRLEDNTFAQRGASMLGGAGASAISGAWNGKGLGKLTGAVGGLFGGGYRGLRNSEGMTSWGQLGANINRTRAETDAARTAIQSLGKKGEIKRRLRNYGDRTKDWLAGGITNENLLATNDTLGEFSGLDEALNGNDREIQALKRAREESQDEYKQTGKIAYDAYNCQGEDLKNKIAEAEIKAFEDKNGRNMFEYEKKAIKEKIERDYKDKELFEKEYAKHKSIVKDVMEEHYKSSINKQKVTNMANKKLVTTEYSKSVSQSLQKTINTLGKDKGKAILGNYKSIAEFENAYKDLADGTKSINERLQILQEISDVENRLRDENTIQKVQKERQKKDKS